MLLFGLIIFMNMVVGPLFSLAFAALPEAMWELLKLGVGGLSGIEGDKYVGGMG